MSRKLQSRIKEIASTSNIYSLTDAINEIGLGFYSAVLTQETADYARDGVWTSTEHMHCQRNV